MSTNETTQVSHREKFLFERSFDEGLGAKKDPHIEEAFARGREEGIKAARLESEHILATETAKLLERLAGLEAMRAELGKSMTRQAVELATGLVRKMMPNLSKRGGFAEVEALLVDMLNRVLEEPRVVFRVPDAMLDAMQARIGVLAKKAAYAGEIVLIADDRLGSSDCLVEWADGGAERNLDRLWNEVDAMLARALDTSFNSISPPSDPTPNTIQS
ncbi:MAG: FliH/SctL family protein [Alphaproteobacteria bacterium]|nr:FliH/SctL family protein [Alphaproteobacteria bacterium]